MAIERTITSPVGDTLTVYSDADLLTLFGDGRGVNSVALMTSWQPRRDSPRAATLLALWHEGAAVDRKSGAAARVLRDRAVRYGLPDGIEPAQVTAALKGGAFDLFVERETNAKRTYVMRLIGVAERWLPYLERPIESAPAPTAGADATGTDDDAAATAPPEPEPADVYPGGDASTNGHGSDSAVAAAPVPAHEPVEFELTNAVATALLTQVVEIIATGSGSGPALGRLQLDVEALEARLGTQVAYVDKLRRQLREAGDEITALRVERDGLRQRLRSAEHNLSVATSADAQRIIDAEVRRQVDRMMRQAPAGAHSKIATVA